MSKIFKSISAPLAIALVATPALAAEPVGRASPTVEDLKVEINQLTAEVEELKKGDSPFTVNGYYRLQATSESLDETNDNSSSFVDQRLRAKITGDLNDNVSLVWYGEFDSPWGDKGSCEDETCGKLSADGVGVETKNAYAELKVPNS
ncbi:MAG: hypothetical protein VX991_01660, partial [Pseudomonadota bacterium]|nr:hypothetical protein [Pseudomonadota bacterium]